MRRTRETKVSNFFKSSYNCMIYKMLYNRAGLEEMSLRIEMT